MDHLSVLEVLFEAFPNSKATEGTTAIYLKLLGDIPVAELQIVSEQCIVECKFLPTIAEIRERYMLLTKTIGQPTPEEAWENVMQEMRRIGSWGAPQFDDPITVRTVKAMDWLQLCRSENMIADRRQFIDMYKGLASRPQQVSRLIPEARQLAESRGGLRPIADLLDVNRMLEQKNGDDAHAPGRATIGGE